MRTSSQFHLGIEILVPLHPCFLGPALGTTLVQVTFIKKKAPVCT